MQRIPWGYLLSCAAEYALFALALILIVPPIPSMEGQRHEFKVQRGLLIAIFSVASGVVAYLRGEERIHRIVIRTIMLIAIGWAVQEAANMY